MSNTAEKTIAQLEDELKEAQRRIDELRRERDERDTLVAEMREHIKARSALTEAWIEAFEMEQGSDGTWRWKSSFAEGDEWFAKYSALVKQWNAAVADFNAKIAPRPVGRPLAASEAQVEAVHKLRKRGGSLRDIAYETGLSLNTVRSIVSDEGRAMRAVAQTVRACPAGRARRGELAVAEQDARRVAAADQREPEDRPRSGAAREGAEIVLAAVAGGTDESKSAVLLARDIRSLARDKRSCRHPAKIVQKPEGDNFAISSTALTCRSNLMDTFARTGLRNCLRATGLVTKTCAGLVGSTTDFHRM